MLVSGNVSNYTVKPNTLPSTRVVMEGPSELFTNPSRTKCRRFLESWRRMFPNAQVAIYRKQGKDYFFEGTA